MKTQDFIYVQNNIVNVIQFKASQNSKIGFGTVVQTYHFSIEQVINNDIKLDALNCLDCPLSYTNDHKLGICYTHKGLQLLGLKSMLKRLNRLYNEGKIKEFDADKLYKLLEAYNGYKFDLVRFGAYGEPIHLGEYAVALLCRMAKKYRVTGYTHQYNKSEYEWANKYFMASIHNNAERLTATRKGFRSFFVAENDLKINDAVNCLASKESKANKTCITCALCNGHLGNAKKDVYIKMH